MGAHWQQSNHKQFACIECHLPDSNIAIKVAYKTKAGLNDLYHETLRSYPASIRYLAEARGIAEGNCLRCHYSTVGNTFMALQGAIASSAITDLSMALYRKQEGSKLNNKIKIIIMIVGLGA